MPELPEEKNVLLDKNDLMAEESYENSVEATISNSEITLNSEVEEKNFDQLFEEPVKLENENVTNNNDIPEPNCLALTVRKDYNLTVIKNIFTTSGRMSLKVALSTLFLNFLRMFF